MKTTKLNFRIDLVMGMAFILVLLSGLTAQSANGRIGVHTFVSLGLSFGIMLHLMLHRKWLAAAAHSSEKSGQLKLSLWLNRLLALSWLWALISGLHGHLDPLSGAPTHVWAAASMTGILLVHLIRHWKWLTVTARRSRG